MRDGVTTLVRDGGGVRLTLSKLSNLRDAGVVPGGWPAKRLTVAMTAAAILAALSASPAPAQTAASLDCGLEAGPSRAVAAVIDGDTLRLDDSKEVRLIGLMAPRAEDAGAPRDSWPPENASRKALADRLAGRTVALAFQGPRSDRYGRVLAHVFLDDAGASQWVQAAHLEAGHARAFAPPEHAACLPQLLAREKVARAASRGLWGNAAYQVRPADRPGELVRSRGTFQLVAGRVAKVSGTRTLAILELTNSEAATQDTTPETKAKEAAPKTAAASGGAGRDRAGFRIVWNRAANSVTEAHGRRTGGLAGADVLVRGWIEMRRGPEIEILGATQLDVQ